MLLFLSALMVANGIVFFPPSELILLAAYNSFSGYDSFAVFSILALSNSIGHIVLFLVSRMVIRGKWRWLANLESMVSSFPVVSKLIISFGTIESNAFFGRFIPVVKTAVSISSAASNVGVVKYVLLTCAGNIGFAFAWFAYFAMLSGVFEQKVFIGIVIVSTAAIYYLHFKVSKLRAD